MCYWFPRGEAVDNGGRAEGRLSVNSDPRRSEIFVYTLQYKQKTVSCFFKNQSIVSQLAVTLIRNSATWHWFPSRPRAPLVYLGIKLKLRRGCSEYTFPDTIMESTDTLPIPARSGAEGGIPTSTETPSLTGDHTTGTSGRIPPCQPPDDYAQRHVDMGFSFRLDHYLNSN